MKVVKLDNFTKPKKPWEVEGVEWREVKLEEIAKEIKSGGTPARKNKEYWENGTIPWVKIQDIPDDGYVDNTEEKITEKGLNNSSAKLLPKGTILFTIFATIGRVGILNIRAATNQAIAGIIPKEDYNEKYLYWVLRKFGEKLARRGRGGAQNNVNLTFLKNLKIPIPFRNGKPDLETQKKIVEYIEANFSRIDKILEKKKKELEQLDELWESVLEQAFKPKEGEEWREVRLGDIAKVVGGSTAPQNKKFYENGKHLFVRVSDLGAKKNFDPLINTKDKLNDEGIKRNKLVLVPKDTIVFPKSGAAILTNSRAILGKEAFIVNHLAGVIAQEDKSYSRYLLFYLSKVDMGEFISPNSSYPSLKLETIKNLKIPFPFRNNQPDFEKQREIANYLDSVYEKIKAIKERVQKQIELLEEMKESILEEVFSYGRQTQAS